MPASIQNAALATVLPSSLSRAFVRTQEYAVMENVYRNGEAQRSVQATTSHKRRRPAKRLPPNLRNSGRSTHARNGPVEPFYLYDPYEDEPHVHARSDLPSHCRPLHRPLRLRVEPEHWARTFGRARLRTDRTAHFWESRYGAFGAFTYNAPEGRQRHDAVHLPLRERTTLLGTGSGPRLHTWFAYPLHQTVTRFPTEALQAGYPRSTSPTGGNTMGQQLYLPRLLEFDGIRQGIGNEADETTFTFGNADRVMRDLANDVDLYRAASCFT